MCQQNRSFYQIILAFFLYVSLSFCSSIILDDANYTIVSYSKSFDQYVGPTSGSLWIGTSIFDYDTTNYRSYVKFEDVDDIPDWYYLDTSRLLLDSNSQSPENELSFRLTAMSSLSTSASQLYSDIYSSSYCGSFSQESDETVNDYYYLGTTYDSYLEQRIESSDWCAVGFASTFDNNETYLRYYNDTFQADYEIRMSSSGTLAQDEKWGSSNTLTGNVSVPTGKTLKLFSGLSLTIGSYYIKSTGGTITAQSGITLSPSTTAIVKQGAAIKGYYPTVSSALSNATSGQTVYHPMDTHSLSSNLTVPSGVTLAIQSGTTINLSSYKIDASDGTITVSGGATINPYIRITTSAGVIKGLYPTIQSAINAASSTQRVRLDATTYSENISMKGGVDLLGQSSASTILAGDITSSYQSTADIGLMYVQGDVTINGGSGLFVYNLRFRDKIDINYGSGHEVYNCTHEPYYSGWLDVYSTSVIADNYYSTNYYPGRGVQGGSATLSMELGELKNMSYGLFAASSLTADLNDMNFCSNTNDIYVASTADVDVVRGTYGKFSSCPPPTSGPGSISYDYCTACGGAKAIAPKMTTLSSDEADEKADKKIYKEAYKLYKEVQKSRQAARQNEEEFNIQQHRDKLDQAVDKLKKLADKYPKSESIISGFQLLSFIWNDLGEPAQFALYASDLKKKSMSDPFKYGLLQGEAHSLVSRGAFEEAIALNTEMAGLNVELDLQENALYGKGVICQYFIGDKKRAEEAYNQVLVLNPESSFSEMIRSDLERLNENYNPGPKEEIDVTVEGLSLGNYPNPSNPNTTIYYTLPEEGQVTIRVYDVMGRQVQALVNNVQMMGKYEVQWDGKDSQGVQAASGVYFYQLQFEDQTITQKLMLVR
ncbi:T9SS type A sorting domain-containing protein [candidate division KSB1 bacterium]|nr:T9SS type A sorting domain-containing protein [candidate division KSB1 bacterium]